MNTTYQAALNGTLASVPTGSMMPVTVWNNQVVDVRLIYLTPFATQADMGVLPAGYSTVIEACPGDYVMVITNTTGSFIGVISVSSGTRSVYFGPNYQASANDIGAFPSPTSSVPIPTAPPKVYIAGGKLSNGNLVIREQQWVRSPGSLSIMPNQKQDISSTSTTALQQTSSTTDTIAASLGASASAGWGPFSASVSASLSTSSTSFQQVNVSNETMAYQADHIAGSGGTNAEFYIKWALMDNITVLDPVTQLILSSAVNAQAPILIDGPYTLPGLAAIPAPAPRALGLFGFPRLRIDGKRLERGTRRLDRAQAAGK